MTLACTVQGNPVSILAGSFNASYTLGNRPTGSVRIYYTGSTPPADEGDEIIITRTSDSSKVFAGRVTSVTVNVDEAGNKIATLRIGGYEAIADRRMVGEVYFNRTAGYIVDDIISKYLAGDGITAGTIDAGAVIPRAVFGYQTASDVLRTLADANGYIWFIDRDKALHFTERDAVSAPVGIDEATQGERSIRGLSLDRSLTQYRNRQLVQYTELTSVRTESFAGDGQTKTWALEFPVAAKPTITVNGIAKTVGIAGLDPEGSNDFYWSKGTNSIGQDVLAETIGADWGIEYIGVDTNSQVGIQLTARGGYAANLIASNSTIALYQISNKLGTLAQIYETGYDTLLGISFIDDEYLALTYTDAGTHYIRLVRRVGNSLEFVGTPSTTTNPVLLSAECSNGEYVAVSQTLTGDSLELYKFDKSAQTLTFAYTVIGSGGTQNPIMVWYGDYLAYASNDNLVKVYKLDRTADTLSSIYSNSEGLGVQVASAAWVDKYLYTGFSTLTGDPQQKQIVRHSLDISTDTVTRLGVDTVTSADDTANMVSINNFIFVSGRGAPSGGNYFRVSLSDGSLEYFGNFSYSPDISTIALAPIRNAGASFIMGISSGGNPPIFIAKPSNAIIAVTYQGTFPNVTQIDDFTEQAARITAEGGTGIYEAFQLATDTESEPSAIDIAQAILARYGNVPRVVSFETLIGSLSDGQVITINWPSLGISNEEFLIERIGIRDERGTALWYSLRCISGRDIGNWQEFWRSLRPSSSFDFGGSDTLPKAVAVADMVGMNDDATAVSAATQTNWGEGNWSEMEWQTRL